MLVIILCFWNMPFFMCSLYIRATIKSNQPVGHIRPKYVILPLNKKRMKVTEFVTVNWPEVEYYTLYNYRADAYMC